MNCNATAVLKIDSAYKANSFLENKFLCNEKLINYFVYERKFLFFGMIDNHKKDTMLPTKLFSEKPDA